MMICRQKLLQGVVSLGLLAALHVHAESTPTDSPFLPTAADVADPRSTSSEPYQLSAIGVVGDRTFVSIYETAEKRSHWIAVGGGLGDLQIVSCDVDAEQAVVRIGGKLRTLTLPKAAVNTSAVSPSAAGSAASVLPAPAGENSGPVAVPASEEDQAREARMLVSDLLEIGMQQRKAYEDAQKKAAEQKAQP